MRIEPPHADRKTLLSAISALSHLDFFAVAHEFFGYSDVILNHVIEKPAKLRGRHVQQMPRGARTFKLVRPENRG